MLAGRTPLWRLFAVVAAAGALVPATGPVRDYDVYWHVRLGNLILRTRRLPTRELWDFPAAGRPWVAHSWLSDVVLALAQRAGWGGVVVLRLALGAALLALLARHVVRGSDAVVGPVVFAVAALGLAPAILERPQLFALVLLAALLPLLDRARAGTAPHWLAAAALGWLWASLHGSWPLLPAAFVLTAVLTRSRGLVLAALAAVAGAALTPAGPALLTRPYVVSRAAGSLAEWQPPVLWRPALVPFVLLVTALVVAWARGGRPVPRGEMVWCAAVVAAALSAGRNVSFATVLLAPIVARRISALVPEGRRSTLPRWTLAVAGAVGVLVLGALYAANPRLPTDAPRDLVATLRAHPGDARVLNSYNVGGYLTGLGGDDVSAAVDGRIDAFPAGFLDRYRAAMDLRGDWAGLVDELDPTHALLEADVPLAHALENERGWRRLGADGTFVLLAAP
ncbi:MAG TPA: hypothetical protein VNQ77_08700 [Frankiaceae bacterium]|nr:hypothetical protein [Frankiaceae bacterium]